MKVREQAPKAGTIAWVECNSRETRTLPTPALRGLKQGAMRLKAGTVGVFGAGAVGGNVVLGLARHGVGTILALDPDTFGPESVHTQPCVPEDAGQPKAHALGIGAHEINPCCRVLAGQGVVQDLPLSVWRKLDVAVVAGDNLEMLVSSAKTAMGLGMPLIQGAVFGEPWSAIVRGYDLRHPDRNSCPACTMSADEWRNLRARRGCDPDTARRLGQVATRTLPVICNAAAQLVVAETLKRLLEHDKQALCGEELNYSLLSHRGVRTELPKSDGCRLPHRRWNIVDLPDRPQATSLALVAERFGPGRCKALQVRSEIPWVSFALCSACGRKSAVRRFARLGSTLHRCRCGETLIAGPRGKYAVVPQDDLEACWDAPLANLGLGMNASLAMGTDTWTYFFFPGDAFDALVEEANHEE